MNPKRKIISWEPEHRDFSLNKRSNKDFEREQRAESHPRFQDMDYLRFSKEENAVQYPKPVEGRMKSFSPVPSRLDSQKIIGLNSFREMLPKVSQRSILGGGDSTMEMKANLSNLEVLGPRNDSFLGANVRQHDNNPLNNSSSDLEKDIFKTKTLPENDSVSRGFGSKFGRQTPDQSFYRNFDIDSGLSELAPIKPPNAYRQITSINYSNYNENVSGRDLNRGSIHRNQNQNQDEQLSFRNSNQNHYVEQRRRMTPREIFDMKRRSGSRDSSRNLRSPWQRMTHVSPGNFKLGHRLGQIPSSRTPISERLIVSQERAFKVKGGNTPSVRFIPRTMSQSKPNRNTFHSSQKSISINDEFIKKRFQVQTSMAQFNNHPPLKSHEKRREFYPYESTEHSKFKKVKITSKSLTPNSQYATTKVNQKEHQRKKNEDERIQNNMLESIGMIELGQFKRYRKLLAFLISLFVTGNVKSEGVDLFHEELQILKIIIYRKFKKHIDIRYFIFFFIFSLNKKQLVQRLCSMARKSCLKKNEERWKFIYKKTIKALKQNFFIRHADKMVKPSEDDFLKYYFAECAAKDSVPLDFYKDPLIQKYRKRKEKNKKLDNNCPKSINTRYLSLIFQSPHFVKDFFEYINKKFKEDYLNEIPEKFFLIFKNYISCNSSITFSKEYFQNNKRCKLPWTFHDVDLAIQAMREINREIQNAKNRSSDYSQEPSN